MGQTNRTYAPWVMDQYWGFQGNAQNTSAKKERVWIDLILKDSLGQ